MSSVNRKDGPSGQVQVGQNDFNSSEVAAARAKIDAAEKAAQQKQAFANAQWSKSPSAGQSAEQDAKMGWQELRDAWAAWQHAVTDATDGSGNSGTGATQNSGSSDTSGTTHSGSSDFSGADSSGSASSSDNSGSTATPDSSSNPSGSSSGSSGSSSVQGATGTASATATSDGYTVDMAVKEMKHLWENGSDTDHSKSVSDEQYEQIAKGVIAGVNEFFSGKNGLGDFSKAPPSKTEIARQLLAMSYQESKFGTAGQDAGGLLQVFPERLEYFNQKAPASLKGGKSSLTSADLEADHALAARVAVWSIANPVDKPGYRMVDVPAGQGTAYEMDIPSDPLERIAYFWNYHPEPGHGHTEGELNHYMTAVPGWSDLLKKGSEQANQA